MNAFKLTHQALMSNVIENISSSDEHIYISLDDILPLDGGATGGVWDLPSATANERRPYFYNILHLPRTLDDISRYPLSGTGGAVLIPALAVALGKSKQSI
jgi:hypothetical protein